MAEKAEIQNRTHSSYDDNIGLWELYFNAALGGDNFANSDNLFTHRLEDSDDFDQRLERIYYLNFCDAIPEIYNTYIFKENVERPPDNDLAPFRLNCDGKGSHIADIIRKAGYFSSVYGIMYVFVDIPSSTKQKPSKADIAVEGILPYCSLIHPTDLVDWSVNSRGQFNWIIIKEQYNRDLDPEVEREEEEHFRVITTEKWWVVDKDGESVKFEDGSESSGTNDIGLIPLVPIYHRDLMSDHVGQSMIKDIVLINRTIMNWCSCIDEQIERQTFSQLVMPDNGTLAEDKEAGGDPLHKVGTASILTYAHDAAHPPEFISPNIENINTIWKLVVDHIKEIYRLAGLVGGTGDLYTSRSGRQSQMSFLGVDSSLAAKAASYQKAENAISKIALLYMNKSIDNYQDVKYPATFNVVALAEEIDGTLKILERNFSETLNKTIMKDISRKAVPMASNDVRMTIEKEIDSGDGVVDPLNSGITVEAEKDGDGNPNSDQSKSFKTKGVKDKEDSQHTTEE